MPGGRILIVAACTAASVAAAASLCSWSGTSKPWLIIIGEQHQRTRTPPRTDAWATFTLRNVSGQEVEPVVRYASCGCVNYRIEPERVGPGEQFALHVRGRVSVFGKASQTIYRVGCAESDHEVSLLWTIVPDMEADYLLVAPRTVLSITDTGKTSHFLLDINYHFTGDSGDPTKDIVLQVQDERVLAATMNVVQTSRSRSGFAGRVSAEFVWTDHIRPESLTVDVRCRGGLRESLVLAWREE